MEANKLDAKRRRIVDRGSDRMALITGRIQTLNSNSPARPSLSHHSRAQSSPVFISQPHHPPNPDVGHEGGGDTSGVSLGHDTGDGFSKGNASNFRSIQERKLRKCETSTDAIRAPAAEFMKEAQLSPVTTRVPESSDGKEQLSKGFGHYLNSVTPKEISACILASENIRVYCSIVIALLVVLSYINTPRKIVKSKSIIASRPLYVLLLTDFTIVLARLIVEKRKVSDKAKEEEEVGPWGDGHGWVGAFKILEIGLVLHQTIRAIFIDCSFYLVIVICGLSLV